MLPDSPEDARLSTRDPAHRRVERAMGTVISLFVPDGGASSAIVDAAFDWFHEVDRRFSPFLADSEVGRLMRGELGPLEPSEDLAEVLDLAQAVELLSAGAFDIRRHRTDLAPDPTGLVKGWSVDRAAGILRSGGIERFYLNAGGDVVVRGGQAEGRPWRIGVVHPDDRRTTALVLLADDLAVATSGTAERGQHITDARNGETADGLLSVTVVGPDLARADAYATAAFAMGLEGIGWVEALPAYAAVGITHERTLVSTPALERYLE
jgi:thiamine biosynthesis lipoprotein